MTMIYAHLLTGNLFSEDTSSIDVEASAKKFAEMVQATLPQYTIEYTIQNAEGQGRTPSTDAEDMDEDREAVSDFELAEQRIFENYEWVVPAN